MKALNIAASSDMSYQEYKLYLKREGIELFVKILRYYAYLVTYDMDPEKTAETLEEFTPFIILLCCLLDSLAALCNKKYAPRFDQIPPILQNML